jgi:hypothetical protein
MVAAGVGDDAAAAFFRGKGGDLVERAAQLEGTDRLLILRLDVKPALILLRAGIGIEADQRGVQGGAAQALAGFLNVL